jgi:hypothetical protein
MKLSTNKNTLATNIDKAADFGINDNDLSHIMGILRSQIYSDKLLAVIREYSTNAMDANKEAGYTGPINVTIPNAFQPTLSFRDYGKGMSDEEVINTYIKYGNSTKRNSNDYTGCLGIGSKAGFAYGDTFTIISYQRKYITTWLARIDESKRGTISIVNQVLNKSNIKTGVEIQVPIRKTDIDTCTHKAKEFFKYWKLQPTINIDIEQPKYLEQTDDYSVLDKTYTWHAKAKVLMGNIVYPIDTDQLPSSAKLLLSSDTVIVNAPLGCLDIAANRETLEYSQRTIDGLTAIAHNVICDLSNNLTKSIKHCSTRIQASLEASKYDNVLQGELRDKIKTAATWNGHKLLKHIQFNDSGTVSHSLERSYRSGNKSYRNKRNTSIHSITLNKNIRLCVHDESLFSYTNATRRIRTLQSKDTTNDIVYYVIPKAKLQSVEPKLTPQDYQDLDQVKPMPAKRTIIANPNGTKKKSIRINVCQLAPGHLKSERLSKESEPIKCETTDKYVYVPLDRFDWQGHVHALDNLELIRNAIGTLNNGIIPAINGVKKHFVSKLPKDEWITLDVYLNNLYKAWAKANKKQNQMVLDVNSIKDWNEWDNCKCACLKLTKADPNVSYLAEVVYNTRSKDKDIIKYSQVINACKILDLVDKSYDFIKTETTLLNKKYPLIEALAPSYRKADDKSFIKHINKYIQSVS